jgi:hypothetical protein
VSGHGVGVVAALIDSLRYRPVGTTAAQMRDAADLIESQQQALRIAREWMLRADKLLAEGGFDGDCSIRHALACGLPSETDAALSRGGPQL